MKLLPFLIIIFASFPALAQSVESIKPDSVTARIQQVENSLSPLVQKEGEALWSLQSQMQKYNLQGLSIAVINNFQIDWAKGYGVVGEPGSTLIDPEIPFQAASMSKFVNAVALMKLKEEGKVDLDEDVNDFLTSWHLNYDSFISTGPITLRQLLSHTSGLSTHGFPGYKDADNLPTIVEVLNGDKPANSEPVKMSIAPLTSFKYSGGGTMITQLMLEDVTGQPYEQYLADHVLGPADMRNSFYSIQPAKYPEQVALAHDPSGKTLKNGYNIYPESAAAGLWTTPTDLARLIIQFQQSYKGKSKRLLLQNSAVDMTKPVLENGITALGMFIEVEENELYLRHSGANRGFRGKFFFSPNSGKGVVVMINGTDTNIIDEIIRSVAYTYKWPSFLKFEASKELSYTSSELKRFTGIYTLGKRKMIVELKKDKLMVSEKKKWSSPITPLQENVFVADHIKPKTTITFSSDENEKINKLIVIQGGTFEWTKVND